MKTEWISIKDKLPGKDYLILTCNTNKECFKNQKVYDLAAQRKEAKQLAAMAIRLMIELT